MQTTNDVFLDEHGNVIGNLYGGRIDELKQEEQERVGKIAFRRMWYGGTQYHSRNAQRAQEMQCKVEDLAEHEKLHAYSTQISESVDFIAAQMSAGFQIDADQKVLDMITESLSASPGFSGGDNPEDVSLTNPLREALISQDVPVWVRWDAVEGRCWYDLYSSENVWFVFDEDDPTVLIRVVVREDRWTRDPATMLNQKRTRYREWFMSSGTCWLGVRWEGADEWNGVPTDLRVPFIPWTNLRAKRNRIVNRRGESLVTDQAISAASRYNALEQVSYLISRYNSHGNLAVVGDASTLKAQLEQRIDKDIADILTFPGGTQVIPITLPTDPSMIEHQRSVLLDNLYGCFGIARQDNDTVSGLGQVTGYALEILNRRTDSTFKELQKQFVGDLRRMFNMMLDMTAYLQSDDSVVADGDAVPEGTPMDEMPWVASPDTHISDLEDEARIAGILSKLTVDPSLVFPNRSIKITLGSSYIVDRTMVRADYVAGLISRAEALRQMGYRPEDIDAINGEIDEEAPQEPEVGLSPEARAAANRIQSGRTSQAAGNGE